MEQSSAKRAATDQNLLFGILALQMDFINRDQLVAAMNAWVLQKSKPLAQVLVEQGALAPDARMLLEPLLAKHIEVHGRDPGESLAAISSASSIREELSLIADPDVQASLAEAASRRHDPASMSTMPPSVGTSTSSGQRFRILRPHAGGGIGEVFVAYDRELNREVALKQIRERRADDPDSRVRFLQEAEVTGGLEHPCIVPVYGLGSYPDGRPFYAMRFIKGDSLKSAIERFHKNAADASAAGSRTVELRKLLGRFLDVCHAIEYAHSRGVLHRDLKPGNIMLGKFGETLVVDWGLAKVVGKAEPGETTSDTLRPSTGSGEVLTVTGAAVGTPGFMSPEQASGRIGELGPATDVYSLGATLYVLLTGEPPFPGDEIAAVLQAVEKGDFRRPREVKSDVPPALEAICLKAMALRPADRYRSVHALAEDLEHWLADEPVAAYPEPFLVRAGRWRRRHRTLVLIAASLLVTLTIGLSIGTVILSHAEAETRRQWLRAEANKAEAEEETARAQANKAEAQQAAVRADVARAKAQQAAAKAQAVNAFLTDDLLAAARPETLGRDVTIRQALDKCVTRISGAFAGQPQAEAAVRCAVGETYRGLGRYAEAEAQLRTALQLSEKADGPDAPSTIDVLDYLEAILRDRGKTDEALQVCRRLQDACTRVLGPDHHTTLSALEDLALLLLARGQRAEAEKLLRDALARRTRTLGADAMPTMATESNLGRVLLAEDRLAEAEAVFRHNLQAEERVLGPAHSHTLLARNNLAVVLKNEGRLTEAEPFYRANIDAYRKAMGPEHPFTLIAMKNLAGLLVAQGKFDEAEPLARQAAAAFPRVLGPHHAETLGGIERLGEVLQGQQKLDEADKLFRQTLEDSRRYLGAENLPSLRAALRLGCLCQARGKTAEAESLLRANQAVCRRVLGNSHIVTMDTGVGLADVLMSEGKHSDAQVLLEELLDRMRPKLAPSHASLLNVLLLLGNTLVAAGKPEQAEPLLRESLAGREKTLVADAAPIGEAELALGMCLCGEKKFAEAETSLLHAQERLAKARYASASERRQSKEALVNLYVAWGKPEKAAAWR